MTPQMRDQYIAGQKARIEKATKLGDNNKVQRLIKDLTRLGVTYKPVKKPTTPVMNQVKTNNTVVNNADNTATNNNNVNNNNVNNNNVNDNTDNNVSDNDRNVNSDKTIDKPNINVTNQNESNAPNNNFTYNPFTDPQFMQFFKQPDPFTYDPKSDPLYQTMLQNALNNAKVNAKSAQQQALESLNERGISNSSIAASQLAQIEQNALTGAQSQLESSLLPQLTNQAYQRYLDGIANQRAQFDMARGLRGDAYQEYIDRLSNDRANRQLQFQEAELTGMLDGSQTIGARNAAQQLAMQEAGLTGMYQGNQTMDKVNTDRNFAMQQAGLTGMYQGKETLSARELGLQEKRLKDEKARNATQDTEEKKRWWAEYNRSGQQLAQQNKLDWKQLNQREKEFLADEAWKEKNYQLDKDAASWQRDPNNPLNMQREATAEAKGAQDKNEYVASQTAEFIKNIRDNMEDDSLGMTYKDAVQQVNDLIIAGVYTKEDGTKILNALKAAGLEPKEKSKSTYKPAVTGSNMGSIFR